MAWGEAHQPKVIPNGPRRQPATDRTHDLSAELAAVRTVLSMAQNAAVYLRREARYAMLRPPNDDQLSLRTDPDVDLMLERMEEVVELLLPFGRAGHKTRAVRAEQRQEEMRVLREARRSL